jgi:heme oxygenase (mycobilin-producing)
MPELQVMMITVLSRFTVINGMEREVRDAFVNRPHLVEKAAGFLRLEVLSPADHPAEFWLFTYWDTEQHFREWHKHHRHESHQFMPKGLRLDARGTQVQVLNHVAS